IGDVDRGAKEAHRTPARIERHQPSRLDPPLDPVADANGAVFDVVLATAGWVEGTLHDLVRSFAIVGMKARQEGVVVELGVSIGWYPEELFATVIPMPHAGLRVV